MDIRINASDEKVAEMQTRMQEDRAFLEAIANNPRAALAEYGVEMDDDTAAAIKRHFESLLAPGPGPSPVSVAVGIGFAVAVAIP